MAGDPMRAAYADPPYPGQAARHYADHPDYAGEVDHRALLRALDTEYDGWLLHTSSVALPGVLALAAEVGLTGYRVHDLRHSTASILLGAGVPLPVISRMLGHSTIRVTADLYAHVEPRLERDAADRLQGALTKASGVRSGVRAKGR